MTLTEWVAWFAFTNPKSASVSRASRSQTRPRLLRESPVPRATCGSHAVAESSSSRSAVVSPPSPLAAVRSACLTHMRIDQARAAELLRELVGRTPGSVQLDHLAPELRRVSLLGHCRASSSWRWPQLT